LRGAVERDRPAIYHPPGVTGPRPTEPVLLDGATMTVDAVERVARGRARVRLTQEAWARNEAARETLLRLIARGEPIYGVSTGVGSLRDYAVTDTDREEFPGKLLRSHAGGAGLELPEERVRAAMAIRANQIGAGGAGVAADLLDALVAALNADITPVTRELGSLGTGDLTALSDIGLALLGEGIVRVNGELVAADVALRQAGVTPGRLGPRDGLAFISSNAVTIGHAALLVIDVARLLDTWLTVAALSFEAAGADPRVHSLAHRRGQSAVAARLRERLAGYPAAQRPRGSRAIQDPYPFRALPQVDGAVHEALSDLGETVFHELNLAGENGLVIADEDLVLHNGNPHAAPLAGAIDHVRTALAQSAALIAARVSTLLDASFTGLSPFLAQRPGPDSGALVLEYTAHAAAAEVRSLVTPVAAQTVSVSRGVESHSSLAPIAARRAEDMLGPLQVLIATELVVAVRALDLAGARPVGAGTVELFDTASAVLDHDLADRALHPDVEAARELVSTWALRDWEDA
jgi:histidine ammonia-lyase